MTGTQTLRERLADMITRHGQSTAMDYLRGKGYSLSEAIRVIRSVKRENEEGTR
jgi:hypothetical protein